MGLYMVFMYNFLCMSVFHSTFQFLSHLGGGNDNTARCSVDFVNYVLAFQSTWLQKWRDVE